MRRHTLSVCILALWCVLLISPCQAVLRGWSTWNVFRYNVSEQLLMTMAASVINTPLFASGYNYILLDDGWPSCTRFGSDGRCLTQAPRDAEQRIIPDPQKFPQGMAALTAFLHAKGLRVGIYTAVSNATCGGYTSSLGFEEVDAATFAAWGFDFVKHDTCNYDCGVHDGCIQNSTKKMGTALAKLSNQTGQPILYYIDDGNDSSGPRMYNPLLTHTNMTLLTKIALQPSALVWNWGPSSDAFMAKFWFDHQDYWWSTLDNIHQMAGMAMYSSCTFHLTPDMVTIGQGGETAGMYRAQMFLWSMFSVPIILGLNLGGADNETLGLLTAREVLAVADDSGCVSASLASSQGGGEVWVKPLADGNYAVTLFNTATVPLNITVTWSTAQNRGHFYPDVLPDSLWIRDLYLQQDLGWFSLWFTAEVPAQDAKIFKLSMNE